MNVLKVCISVNKLLIAGFAWGFLTQSSSAAAITWTGTADVQGVSQTVSGVVRSSGTSVMSGVLSVVSSSPTIPMQGILSDTRDKIPASDLRNTYLMGKIRNTQTGQTSNYLFKNSSTMVLETKSKACGSAWVFQVIDSSGIPPLIGRGKVCKEL